MNIKKIIILSVSIILIAAGVFLFARKADKNSPPANNNQNTKIMQTATIKTNLGDIKMELCANDAPKTVKNFIDLAEKGFYNNLIFHRVVKNFVIQGGDPFCHPAPTADAGICGTGGPGYQFEDELNANTESYKTGYKKGIVAMANSGPNTNGSQFFIMLADNPLPHNYTIFGKVVAGQDIVDKIGSLPVNPVESSGDLYGVNQNGRPLQPAIIKEITILK